MLNPAYAACFNGAAVRRPRRVPAALALVPIILRLQRSRGPKTAESTANGETSVYLVKLQRSRGPKTAESSLFEQAHWF